MAGGGGAIGKVAGELSDRFSKVANPTVPPKPPEPALEYKPPEPTPMGPTTWSPAQVRATPPKESLSDTFNRNVPGGLMDVFNSTVRNW